MVATRAPGVLPAGMELLGYAGVLPFVALGGALYAIHDPELSARTARGLLAYGCAILAFVGAVHWGVLLSGGTRPDGGAIAVVGVLPCVAGAVSVVLPVTDGLGLQIIAFAALWLYEHRTLPADFLPAPYLRLRRVLTATVLTVLVAVLFGPASGPVVL